MAWAIPGGPGGGGIPDIGGGGIDNGGGGIEAPIPGGPGGPGGAGGLDAPPGGGGTYGAAIPGGGGIAPIGAGGGLGMLSSSYKSAASTYCYSKLAMSCAFFTSKSFSLA